jgi:hypothetical protein
MHQEDIVRTKSGRQMVGKLRRWPVHTILPAHGIFQTTPIADPSPTTIGELD